MLLSRATGSVSSGYLSTFDVICSKAHEIAADDIFTIGNEERCPWQHNNFQVPNFIIKTLSCLIPLMVIVLLDTWRQHSKMERCYHVMSNQRLVGTATIWTLESVTKLRIAYLAGFWIGSRQLRKLLRFVLLSHVQGMLIFPRLPRPPFPSLLLPSPPVPFPPPSIFCRLA